MRQQARLFQGLLVAALASIAIVSSATAQPGPGGAGWGPGMMMGPGMMGGQGFGFLCNPRMAGFAEWRLAQIEAAVKPNDAQKAALDMLTSVSQQVWQTVTALQRLDRAQDAQGLGRVRMELGRPAAPPAVPG